MIIRTKNPNELRKTLQSLGIKCLVADDHVAIIESDYEKFKRMKRIRKKHEQKSFFTSFGYSLMKNCGLKSRLLMNLFFWGDNKLCSRLDILLAKQQVQVIDHWVKLDSDFIKYFPEAANKDDWSLFGWAIKNYGVDTCTDKIKWMHEHGKTHPIINPKGLFRMALVKDYQPSAFVKAKMHGDEKARRAIENGRRRAEEWEKMVANFDYDVASASLQELIEKLG